MNASTQRADLPPESFAQPEEAPEAGGIDQTFDRLRWREAGAEREFASAGGRAVLGWTLAVLALLWVGYTAWSAGRVLADQPLSSPAVAQWVAIAAGPLALLGLGWLMFGRTRRREAEKFTRSVIAMRSEARSLEALLEVLSERVTDSKTELTRVAQQLMQLGDEATGRLGSVTRELESGSQLVAKHSEALDRAAESARNDVAVLLDDLPKAEASARAMAEQLRSAGSEASQGASQVADRVSTLSERTREAEAAVADAAQRLVTHLTQIESAGAAAALRVGEAESSFSAALDSLLERTSQTLGEIRSGIDVQSTAVAALVEQASAGIGRAGIEAAETLGSNVTRASGALDALSARLAEQERASHSMVAEIDRALGELESRFASVADQGDVRASSFVAALGRARTELEALDAQSSAQEGSADELLARTVTLRQSIDRLSTQVRDQLATALGDAEAGAERLSEKASAARPEVERMRDAAAEASGLISTGAAGIAEQQERFAALLASLDEGVGSAEGRLAALAGAISSAHGEAARLSGETAPALVAAMVQVKDAAAHAADRAREALASVIPDSADKLSEATREALERTIREGIEERLREVETTAARAVESARAASDRLTQQMLNIGQSAAALERHVEQTNADQRERDSEAFARRVSLLIDSMHSASIDVGKILSDEVDEKAWGAYLKGNRGIFTRRAARLLDGSETRAIRAHYEADGEFQQSVNRYVHDFEAMLRRVMAERDGGIIAVTLMSSDMGKLYAALAQVIDRRR